ncbi:hypothetical protein [Halorhabdus sp. CUG00001]|uniref:hypothetical protein n=1 Tax=Halorhabdus sp. CUG00001 TaxID=2600297 RepID=UPI00131EC327|nr:hypothetical protein [Halorhabdus sp. CUG00001]
MSVDPGTDYDGDGETFSEEGPIERVNIAEEYGLDLGPSKFTKAVGTALGPLEDLKDYVGQLTRIARNPVGFVIGSILSVVVGWILEIWKLVVDGVQLVLVGSEPGYESSHTYLGLEDIPLLLWDLVASPFEDLGGLALGLFEDGGIIPSTISSLATSLGPLAWPATVAAVVLTIVAAERIAMNASRASLAAIPVIGPALEVLLYE